jgi:LmbE family N-acetylglucosaminyl deacetylase
MKILVVAPHPDDEVLGCGGIIKKYFLSGSEVSVCFVTKPYTPDWTQEYIDNKQKEIKKAQKVLGVKELFFLDFPTVKLDTIPQKELNDSINKVIGKVKPEIVFIPFAGDINKDHKLVSEACSVALRPKPESSVQKVFYYEVLSETEWSKPPQEIGDVFIPNYYEDISDYLQDKIQAMECYKSELKEYPHPRSTEGIEILAKKRGIECGTKAAEAFMLVREIKIGKKNG